MILVIHFPLYLETMKHVCLFLQGNLENNFEKVGETINNILQLYKK